MTIQHQLRGTTMKGRSKLLTGAGLVVMLAWTVVTSGLGPNRAAVAAESGKREVADDKATATADQALQRLKAGNNRFADEMLEKPNVGRARRQELAQGQRPFAIVLTCADSRVSPELIFNQGLGDIFVLRVAGNIAEPFFVGSIDYAVEQLHVPLIVLLGHEKCGAVEAALGKERLTGNLGKVIGEIEVGKDLPADVKARLTTAIRHNARRQAQLLVERSDIIKRAVEKKELRIVSGVYELATGKVEWLEE